MQFNSYVFILQFLPVMIVSYFIINKINQNLGKIVLIIGSAVFYIYGGWNIAAILGASIVVNYTLAFLIDKLKKIKKPLIFIDIIANVALLFYFKYYNFTMLNICKMLDKSFTMKEIILPLGISFFTFQQIMYVVNVYRGTLENKGLIDYLVYILYFPKIIMGPIVEPAELIAQINDEKLKKVDWDNIASGLKLFSFGLFKKLILADTFAKAVNWGFGNVNNATAMDLFLVMLFYTFEIYFDFSGYTDMAVGVSGILNIKLPMNFDSPYKATSIRDFWKRWHMSLTKFLTKYIYIPLGGSRKGEERTYINTMIVFLVSGIWHGANWTFIVWGVVHGALSMVDRWCEEQEKKLIEAVRWMGTFFAVNVLWLLFRAESIMQWRTMLKKMFCFQDMSVSQGLIDTFNLPETQLILDVFHLKVLNDNVRGFSLFIFTLVSFAICLVPENNYRNKDKLGIIALILAAVAFVWGFLCLSSETVFVYFNF